MSHDNALPTRRDVLRLAWPVVLANVASPLLGFVDTAVIGHAGHVHELGAIALGALLFNFVFWSFGFLRMGTTGFTAQALGAEFSHSKLCPRLVQVIEQAAARA